MPSPIDPTASPTASSDPSFKPILDKSFAFIAALKEWADRNGVEPGFADLGGPRLVLKRGDMTASFRLGLVLEFFEAGPDVLVQKLDQLWKEHGPERTTPPTIEEARERLLIKVDDPKRARNGILELPFAPGLVLNLVIDYESSMSFITEEQLAGTSVDLNELRSAAAANTRQMLGAEPLLDLREQITRIHPDARAWTSNTRTCYESSALLFLRDLIEPWPKYGLLVWAASRDHVFLAALDRAEDIAVARTIGRLAARVYRGDGYPISPIPWWFDGERWEQLTPVNSKLLDELERPDAGYVVLPGFDEADLGPETLIYAFGPQAAAVFGDAFTADAVKNGVDRVSLIAVVADPDVPDDEEDES